MLFFFCLGEMKYWKIKLINNLCSTGFGVSILLPTFFHFEFGSNVKKWLCFCHFSILVKSFTSMTAGRKCLLEISLTFDSHRSKMKRISNRGDVPRWVQEANEGQRGCRRKRKWNGGRRLAPPEEEALFPCLPARLFRHCSILIPWLRTLPSLNPEPTPPPPPGCCLARGINIHSNDFLLLSRPS